MLCLLLSLLAAPDALTQRYLSEVYFRFSPTRATEAGLHQYDSKLEDDSAAARARQIAALHGYEKKARGALLAHIRSRLLELEVIRKWEKSPGDYSAAAANSIFVLLERPSPDDDASLRALVARERQIPRLLAHARENLRNPPRLFTEMAIDELEGTISFFDKAVPLAIEKATDAKAKAAFRETNAAVVTALKEYAAWLKSDLLPRSNGDFRLGAAVLSQKFARDEMIDVPLERLLALGWTELRKDQAELARVTAQLDPTKSPEQLAAELATIHAAPDALLAAFRDQLSSLVEFIRAHDLFALPAAPVPAPEESQPFMRAMTFVAIDQPGPFEKVATRPWLNVAVPPKEMAAFNLGANTMNAIHEVYPGHYLQWISSPARELPGVSSSVEGWAHYVEQMMLDEGYRAPRTSDREAAFIHLAQLQRALIRDVRLINSIKLHTEPDWTLEQATELYVKEAHRPAGSARNEVRRGVADATFLCHTLGKLMILKLREDLRHKQGAAFTLKRFHDDFLRQGLAPIAIIRETLLHDNSPVL